ncbi:MAG: BrnT family toxin [Planctomycetes bacterium]|nr:BrnT family toxin [Planctomycetota bacterium]
MTIGYSFRGRLLVVAHAEREKTIRIISTRTATKERGKMMTKLLQNAFKAVSKLPVVDQTPLQ